MPRIFISYRRTDSSTISGRMYDHLVREFSDDNVFKDVYDIPAGSDFRHVIREAINTCNVQLIIIGKDWVDARTASGERRLDNPDDFVRIEVESGLTCEDILVIPVLVSGAPMPSPSQLPDSLRDLTFRNAVIIRDDPDFRGDMDHLIRSIKRSSASRDRREALRRRAPLLATATLILVAGVAVAAIVLTRNAEQARLSQQIGPTVAAQLHALLDRQYTQTAVVALISPTPTERAVLPPTPSNLPVLPPTEPLAATDTVENDPEGAVALIREGDALQGEERYEEALVRYAQAITLDPNNAEAYISRASVYGRLGVNFDQAIRDANRAVELAPDYLWNYDELGKIYYAMGDYEAAITSFTQALEIESYALGYLGRGKAYHALDDNPRAMTDLSQAIALDPNNADAYEERGWVEYDMGRNGDAIRDFTAAIERDAQSTGSYLGRGKALRAAGAFDEAKNDFDAVIELDPLNVDAYYERGYAYQLRDNNSGARNDYQIVVGLDANHVEAHRHLAEVYLVLDEPNDALIHARRVTDLLPEDAGSYALLGNVYYDMERYDEALPQYRRYAELAGDSADVYYLDRINELESRE